MANSLNEELEGKVLVLRESALKPEYRALKWRLFKAGGGFGCHPDTEGRAVFGTFLADGEQCRMDGFKFERVATEEDLAALEEEN